KQRLRVVYRAADGYVTWMFATGHLGARGLRGLCAWMAEYGMAPQWLLDLDWDNVDLLQTAAGLTERLEDTFAAFFATRTRDELLEFAIAHGLMLAPASSVPDVLTDAQ